MARHRRRVSRPLLLLRLGLAAVAVVAGVVALVAPGAPSGAVPSAAVPGPPPTVLRPAAAGQASAAPVRVRVPAIGVDSGLARLGLDAAGALAAPADFAQAGWFAAGPAPGDTGPAVLAGHVDSYRGPAVFFRLRELSAGDEVLVDRADGSTARFVVTRVARYAKSGFPTGEVYGPTPDAQLRLITCGGDFDRSRRSYDDDVVVYAVLG